MPKRLGYLLVFLLAGCVNAEPSRTGVNWQSLKVDSNPGPDRILFDVTIVQRPLDDPFLTTELWTHADEMIVSPDLRELLELNGYRIGLLVGSPPEKLVRLLESERSCVERRGRSTPTGATLTQTLRDEPDSVDAVLQLGKTKESITLDRPRFGLDFLPVLKANQSVRLKITPRVEVGDKAVNYKPVPEESKWALEVKRPTRELTGLAFEFDLAPHQILILGPRPEREDSIGYHSLTNTRDGESGQRLLVLRHLRSKTPSDAAEGVAIPYPALVGNGPG